MSAHTHPRTPRAPALSLPALPFDARGLRDFVAQSWNRRPATLRCAPELLSALRRGFDGAFRRAVSGHVLNGAGRVRFYVDGRLVQSWPGLDLFGLVPTGSFAAYVQALAAEANAPVGLVINDFATHDLDLWRLERALVEPLLRRVGLPPAYTHAGMFGGTYPLTPFGIHRDQSGGFLFQLHGARQIWLWPPCYFERHGAWIRADVVADSPASFKRDATILDLTPGDVAYWPTGYWHIAVARGRAAHAAITVGFWDRPSREAAILDLAQAAWRGESDGEKGKYQSTGRGTAARGDKRATAYMPGKAVVPPAWQRHDVRRLATAVRRGELSAVAAERWHCFRSAGGFVALPPLRAAVPLSRRGTVRLAEGAAVIAAPGGRVYANGRGATAAGVPKRLIALLAAGRAWSIDALLHRAGAEGPDRARAALRLLRWLYRTGTIEIVERR